MNTSSIPVFGARKTSDLLDFADLVHELKIACIELADGLIQAPERQALDLGPSGNMLSMPAAATDIGVHKLVNVTPENAQHQRPVIQGIVTAFDAKSGSPLCVLDGPTVTTRRTAALSMLGIELFCPQAPKHVVIIGYGTQASGHTHALARLYPGLSVTITGRNLDKAQAFVDAHRSLDLVLNADNTIPADTDVVIAVTSSTTPVYHQPATATRLIIGVGAFRPDMAEISSATLQESQLYVDDITGARHEAGDFIQAKIDWNRVKGLADALREGVDASRPIVYKTVGCSAWDLAAVRVVLKHLDTA